MPPNQTEVMVEALRRNGNRSAISCSPASSTASARPATSSAASTPSCISMRSRCSRPACISRIGSTVVPAKAETQSSPTSKKRAAGDYWMPACAGMTPSGRNSHANHQAHGPTARRPHRGRSILPHPLNDRDFGLILGALGRVRRALLPRAGARHRGAQSVRRPLRRARGQRLGHLPGPGAPGGDDPLEHHRERPADRARRRRAGLAHRHVVQRHDRVRERALRAQGAAPQRQAARRDRVRRHARGL